MRAVVQRTGWSHVTVGGECVGRAGAGLTVLLGVGRGDTADDAGYMRGQDRQFADFRRCGR